jgi:hypothetical protein
MQHQGLTFVLAPVFDRWRFTRAAKAQLETSPLGYRLARGALWTIIAAVVTRALGLLSAIIMARLLGRTAFGEFGIIQSTAGLFGALAGLGIGITATKYVAELRELAPDRCGRVIGFALATAATGGVLAGLALVLLGSWLAAHLLAAPHLARLLQCGAGLVVFGALQGAYLGALAGFEAFKRMAWVSWIGSMLGVPLVVVGTLVGGAHQTQLRVSARLGYQESPGEPTGGPRYHAPEQSRQRETPQQTPFLRTHRQAKRHACLRGLLRQGRMTKNTPGRHLQNRAPDRPFQSAIPRCPRREDGSSCAA